ncbi:MAG: hypothetical protein F6K19_31450 [Cyanothece sp. SIO1E1]|nr:hypothetical protein [Cyanothece sp. SIO1E1]
MSPLELLPEKTLRQILVLVTKWSESSDFLSTPTYQNGQEQLVNHTDYVNLRQDGEMWVVKSSGASDISWNAEVGQMRDERLNSLM